MTFFSTSLRRAASSAAPLHHPALVHRLAPSTSSSLTRELHGRRAALLPRLFSSSIRSAKNKKSSSLLPVIDQQIRLLAHVKEDLENRVKIYKKLKGFPFGIEDDLGMGVITLRRNYHGEYIEVVVSIPKDDDKEDGVDEDKDGNEEVDKNKNKNKDSVEGDRSQISTQLIVKISKGRGLSLDFECTAFSDKVRVHGMCVQEDNDLKEEKNAYRGPSFYELDKNLQKALHKYLEERGISASTISTLYNYMLKKHSTEYSLWLEKLRRFVEE